MVHFLTALLASLALLSTGTARADTGAPAEPVMRVSVSIGNGSPYAMYDALGRFQGGLARDIIDHLADHLGLAPSYQDIPRARVEPWLREGRIDAACFLAPDWVAQPETLHWSPPLFYIQQVIVSPPGSPSVTRPQGLFGKRVGTLLNYVYPELGWYFADRRILREDTSSLASNIAKLRRGRIDAFLNDDVTTLYAIERGELASDVRIDPLWTARQPVYCAFSSDFVGHHSDWSTELARMVTDGDVERWIGTYTGGRRVSGGALGRALPER